MFTQAMNSIFNNSKKKVNVVNDTINLEVNKEDALIILGSLVKAQVSKGVKDPKIMDLSGRISIQVLDKLSAEEIKEFRKSIKI